MVTRSEQPFDGLGPDVVLSAAESLGLEPDGRLFALNSYENRVYRLGLDESPPGQGSDLPGVVADAVVLKFYRSGRWSDAQIQEEHDFGAELSRAELPVAAPWYFDGRSLHRHLQFRFAAFACRSGGAPELDAAGARQLLGRTLGRIHAIGALQPFRHRNRIDATQYGERLRRELLQLAIIPAPMDERYAAVSDELVTRIRGAFEQAADIAHIRVHGDCHLGNILWNQTGPVFVDLDDSIQGPRIQDMWMFLSGDKGQQRSEWAALLEGYEQFTSFDFREVALIEPLRALRMMAHAAWLAARWNDPAFPRAFPWFAEGRYWDRHIADLQEQLEILDDPPLLRL